MRSHACTGRTHVDCVGIDFIIVTLSCASVYICGIVGSKRPGPTLRVLLRETGSTPDIRLAPYMWLAGVCFSDFSGYGICNGGPRKGCHRDNYLINVVVRSS
jgi:hypothetical protein